MKYSGRAYAMGWGKPYIIALFSFLLVGLFLVIFIPNWNNTHINALPLELWMLGILSLAFGVTFPFLVFLSYLLQCRHHELNIIDGKLYVSLNVCQNWVNGLLGMVQEQRQYEIHSITSYTETWRTFLLRGDIQYTRYHHNICTPDVRASEIRIPKYFAGTELLRGYLNGVVEERKG